jgi:hypothetical protein
VTAAFEVHAARIALHHHTELSGTPIIDPTTARHADSAALKLCAVRFGCHSAMALRHFAVFQKYRIFQGETRSMRCLA